MAYPTYRQYGRGSGPIFVSAIRCGGQEASLLDCQYSYFHGFYCGSHWNDAAVKCEGIE